MCSYSDHMVYSASPLCRHNYTTLSQVSVSCELHQLHLYTREFLLSLFLFSELCGLLQSLPVIVKVFSFTPCSVTGWQMISAVCSCTYQSVGCAPLVLLCDVGDVGEDHREGHSENPWDWDQSEIPPAHTDRQEATAQIHIIHTLHIQTHIIHSRTSASDSGGLDSDVWGISALNSGVMFNKCPEQSWINLQQFTGHNKCDQWLNKHNFQSFLRHLHLKWCIKLYNERRITHEKLQRLIS